MIKGWKAIRRMISTKRTAPVLLINMPFSKFETPALGLSLLKAGLEERGIGCDVRHFNISLAEIIGPEVYKDIAVTLRGYMIGERIFAHALFDRDPNCQDDQFEDLRVRSPGSWFQPERVDDLLRARDCVESYLDVCMGAIPWKQYQIIGFSTTFQQNVPALALAKRIKMAWQDLIIVFGGANCEGEMGLEIHRQFPFVDLVFRGEADEEFPRLVESLLAGGPIPELPGLVLRRNGESVPLGEGALPVTDLDSLPYPNFADYFEQLSASSLDITKPTGLPFETSRGCWYGVKQQCTFCALNSESIVYRSKHPDRARQEIIHLTSHYDVKRLYATDSILDMGYFRDLIPSLIKSNPNWSIFYEVKANLTKEQLRLLKSAGIDELEPGIESLSTRILELIRKGCTALQNIQLLKWGSQLGVEIFWNLMTDLPGVEPDEYDRMTKLIPSLMHLQPPVQFGPVHLDRFSPYFKDSEEFGITNVRAERGYHFIYPFSDESLDRIAYFFDYDLVNGSTPNTYNAPLENAVKTWQGNHCPGALTSIESGQRLLVYDRRPCAARNTYEFNEAERAIYDYCDEAHSQKAIQKHLRRLGYEVDEDDLLQQLDEWVEARLMVRDGDWYLSLAVQADEFVDQVSDSDVIKQAFAGALAEMVNVQKRKRAEP